MEGIKGRLVEKNYTIKTGEEFDKEFLKKIMAVDEECYPEEYVGELANMEARYERNPKTFVCVMDGDDVAGYINFFPVGDALWEDITKEGMTIRDDDIKPEELADYKAEGNRIYILSVAIREKYRDQKQVVKLLTDAFIKYLKDLNKNHKIEAIAGSAVSDDGRKYLRNCMFGEVRKLDDGNVVYVCDGLALKKLLKNELYFKSYENDIYICLPYVDHENNDRIDKLDTLPPLESDDDVFSLVAPDKIPSEVLSMMEDLNDCLQYEYKSDVVDEMKRVYLGEFQLMHTLDDYNDATDEDAADSVGSKDKLPHIVGEEKVYISLLMHRPSHMYIVTLFIKNSQYSASQLEDQVCQNVLKIRPEGKQDKKGFYQYTDLDEHLRKEYGLLSCGNGKSLVVMSGKPEDEQEFYNILAGESYNSVRQDFHINYEELRECAKANKSIYDYYEVYLTEDVVAFILNDYDKMDDCERVELSATYVFIVEMIIFQNIALTRVVNKVSKALAHQGDVDYDYIMQINEDYARTVKFWQNSEIRYFGTRKEAQQVREAFNNDELHALYHEQKDFLEHMVDVKSARAEYINGLILNIVLFMISVAQIRDYMVEIFTAIYERFGSPLLADASANGTFDALLFGIGPLVALIIFTNKKKKYDENYEKLREEKRDNKYKNKKK